MKKHIEKIIFGLFLVGLLACCVYLLVTLQEASSKVNDVRDQVQGGIVGGSRLEPIPDAEFDGNRVLLHPDRAWRVSEELAAVRAGAKTAESLFDPLAVMRCRNAECFFLLPVTADECHHCGTIQKDPKETVDVVAIDRDRDKDGIPNEVEEKYDFLNPDNPADAHEDHDGDGFSNLEEFRAGTKMDDPASHPSIVKNRLYFAVAQKRELPFRLTRFVMADPEDPKTWELHFSTFERGRWRTQFLRIGDTVMGHKIIAARPKSTQRVNQATSSKVEVDISEVQLQAGEEEPFWITVNQAVLQRDVQIRLVLVEDKWGKPRPIPVDTKLNEPRFITDKVGAREHFMVTNLVSVNNEWIAVDVIINPGKENQENVRLPRFDRNLHLPQPKVQEPAERFDAPDFLP